MKVFMSDLLLTAVIVAIFAITVFILFRTNRKFPDEEEITLDDYLESRERP